MKKTILLIVFALVCVLSVNALNTLNTTNLLLYYNVDEGGGNVLVDSSGNNLNADISDADYNFGRNGTGLEIFDITSRASITNTILNQDLNNTGMIHLMWVYLYDNSTQQYFLEKKDSFRLYWTGTKLGMRIIGKSDILNEFTTTLSENEWHQIGMVYNKTHMILIKDNVTLNSDDTGGGDYTNNTNALLYGHDDGRDFEPRAIIDEMAFYNSSKDYILRMDEHFKLNFTTNTDNHTLKWQYTPWCTFDGENTSSIECSYTSFLRTNYSFKCNDFTKEESIFNQSRKSINIGGGWAENTSISCNATITDVTGQSIVYNNLTTKTKCTTCGRYKIAVFSDSSNDEFQGPNVKTFIPLIESHNAEFSVCVGDCYGIANTNSIIGDLKNFSDTWNSSLKNGLNLFWVVGNHETTTTSFSLEMARRYYNNPHNGQTNIVSRGDETSYSFNYSSSLIVVVNSEATTGGNPNLNGSQLEFVNNTLQGSNKAWKWVFTHDAHFIDVDEVRSNNASIYDMLNQTNATSVAAGINNICHNTSDKFKDIEFTVAPIGDNAQSTTNCLGDVGISTQSFVIIDVFNESFVNISWYDINNNVVYNFSITREVSAEAPSDTTPPTFTNNQNNASTTTFNGTDIQLNITVKDDSNISSIILSWDESGTFVNITTLNYLGNGNETGIFNQTIINLPLTGGTINYKFYSNDTLNNWGVSSTFSFIVQDSTSSTSTTTQVKISMDKIIQKLTSIIPWIGIILIVALASIVLLMVKGDIEPEQGMKTITALLLAIIAIGVILSISILILTQLGDV